MLTSSLNIIIRYCVFYILEFYGRVRVNYILSLCYAFYNILCDIVLNALSICRCCVSVYGLRYILHVTGYPYKSTIYRVKYSRCDWFVSIMLFIIMVSVALMFGSIGSLLNYKTLHPGGNICVDRDSKILYIHELIYNVTDYDMVVINASNAENITSDLYIEANRTYPQWPEPYKMSDDEIDDLVRKSNMHCYKRVCVGVSFNIGFNCKKVSFPCPDVDAASKLDQYEMWKDTYDDDIFGFNITCTDSNGTRYCNSSYSNNSTYIGSTAISILDQVFDRISLANSIYVLYSAFTIFFGSAVVITKEPISNSIGTYIVSKSWWIVLILVIWYVVDILLIISHRYIDNISLEGVGLDKISMYMSAMWYEPCWLDSVYVSRVYGEIRRTCVELSSWDNRFSIASNNYDHDRLVASSYVVDNLPQIYPNNSFEIYNTCDEQMLIAMAYAESISADDSVTYVDIIRRLMYIVLLFLQSIVMHWVRAIFSVWKPLSAESGKVVMPIDYLSNIMLRDEAIRLEFDDNVKLFYRRKNYIPLAFYTIVLLVALVCIVFSIR